MVVKMEAMENFAVKVVNLRKQVAVADHVLDILQGVSLNINYGESLAIVGPSGSGKSTLLGLMAGLDSSSSGEVWLDGQPLHQLNEDQRSAVRAKGIGFVFQNFQLLPGLTALENVLLPLELKSDNTRQARQTAASWLEKVGLAERVEHYPNQLSGGEQQRVAIARAFASGSRIIFADEPTGNLDRQNGDQVTELLFRLNQQQQTTLILVTHDERLAARCQHQRVMDSGYLQALQTTDSISTQADL